MIDGDDAIRVQRGHSVIDELFRRKYYMRLWKGNMRFFFWRSKKTPDFPPLRLPNQAMPERSLLNN